MCVWGGGGGGGGGGCGNNMAVVTNTSLWRSLNGKVHVRSMPGKFFCEL